MLSFEKSQNGCKAKSHYCMGEHNIADLPKNYLREQLPEMPELSELQVVRHFTRLSRKNFSIDTNFYPLGSCTMKYNPRAANKLASLAGFFATPPAF